MSENSSVDDKKVFFKPIKDVQKIRNYFQEASVSTASVQMWFKNQPEPYKTKLSYYGNLAEHFFAWQPKGMIPKGFLEDIKKHDSREMLFSLSLLKVNVFFKADFVSFDGGGLKFIIPETMYEVQRRKDSRFTIPKGLNLAIEIPTPDAPSVPFLLKTVDISASGASIVLSSKYIEAFPVSSVMGPLRINLKGRNIHCNSIVRNIRKMPAESRELGNRLGLEFSDIKAEDSKYIALFVDEEVRKIVSKMMLKK